MRVNSSKNMRIDDQTMANKHLFDFAVRTLFGHRFYYRTRQEIEKLWCSDVGEEWRNRFVRDRHGKRLIENYWQNGLGGGMS